MVRIRRAMGWTREQWANLDEDEQEELIAHDLYVQKQLSIIQSAYADREALTAEVQALILLARIR